MNATYAAISMKKLINISGLGNVLKSAKFNSSLGNSFYLADISALRNYQLTPVSLANVSAGIIPEKLIPGSNTCLQ